jgi:hypothetical protein
MQKQMSSDEMLLLSDYSIYNGGANAVMPDVVALLEKLTEAR